MPEAFFYNFLLYFLQLKKIKYSLLLIYFFVYGQSPFTRILPPWKQRLLCGLFVAHSLVSKEGLHTWKMFNKALLKELAVLRNPGNKMSVLQSWKWYATWHNSKVLELCSQETGQSFMRCLTQRCQFSLSGQLELLFKIHFLLSYESPNL